MNAATHISQKPRNLHYWIGLVLLLALVPTLRSQHLPLRFDWLTFAVAYWLFLAAQSIFVATLLAMIGMEHSQTLQPFLQRYRQAPLRIVVAVVYFGILLWATTWMKALIVTIDTLAIFELHDRRKKALSQASSAILPPAAYLFFGFLMVLAYNYAIVSVRNNFATDPALAAIDRWLLYGHSVSDLTHWAVAKFPLSVFRASEFIYFGMFPQIGAAMILLSLNNGRSRALQFIGTLLTSYYIALLIFYLWPAQGPYTLCPDHFSRFPTSLNSWHIQKTLIPRAIALYHHEPIRRISTDYFIAFPCMHIVQPLIVLWFLRQWKRLVIVLAAYDVVLTAAILLLEMHYVIDIIVGVLVAVLAIALMNLGFSEKQLPESRA